MQLKIILFTLTLIFGVEIVLSGDDGGGGERFKIIKECAKNFSVSGDDAKGMMTGNFTKVTENIQCFVKCVMIENKMMDEENNFNLEVVIEQFTKLFSREKVEQRAEKCEGVTGDSSCEKAYNIFKCLRERRKQQ